MLSKIFLAILTLLFIRLDCMDDPKSEIILPVLNHVEQQIRIGIFVINNFVTSWQLLESLKELFTDKDIKAIIILIDASNNYGSSLAIAKTISLLKASYKKPVIAFGENCLESTDYVIAAGADKIMISEVCRVGSISVNWYCKHQELKNEEEGIVYNFIHAGKFKGVGNANLHIDDRDEAIIQALIECRYRTLIENLKVLRPQLNDNETLWADGKVFSGKDAADIGLVDLVGDKIDLLIYLSKILGVDFESLINSKFIKKFPSNLTET